MVSKGEKTGQITFFGSLHPDPAIFFTFLCRPETSTVVRQSSFCTTFLDFWQTPGYPPGVKPSTHAGELGLRFLGEIALFRKPATIFLNISQNLPQNITKLWIPLFSYIMIVQDKKTKRLIISLFNTVCFFITGEGFLSPVRNGKVGRFGPGADHSSLQRHYCLSAQNCRCILSAIWINKQGSVGAASSWTCKVD